MVQLIPHIKSAHQIRSYVKVTIKLRTKTMTSLMHWHLNCSWSDKAPIPSKEDAEY